MRICKVAVLVFSEESLHLLSCNNHLFLLCFSLNIPKDLRKEQILGLQMAVLRKKTKTMKNKCYKR